MAQTAPPNVNSPLPGASSPSPSQNAIPPPVDPTSPTLESPSLSYPSARARFEFEPGRGNAGTKILMVEWEDDPSTRDILGSWTVSWEGKTHVVAAATAENEENSSTTTTERGIEGQEHRLFFMLPPGVSVPRTVTLTLQPENPAAKEVVWRTNPLPAIFPPELSAPGPSSPASKGVLHTLWAKKRLATLRREIEREARANAEGVALAMAERERDWIEATFGVTEQQQQQKQQPAPKPQLSALAVPSADATAATAAGPAVPLSPSSPLSPGGSRLAEKLRGLKIRTGDGGGGGGSQGSGAGPQLVSPEAADVAVPDLAAFRGAARDVLAAKPAQAPDSRRVGPVAPPDMKTRQGAPMGSLTGMVSGAVGSSGGAAGAGAEASNGRRGEAGADEEDEEQEDLFALPLSPRSPDMAKSPFTFTSADTARYVKAKKGQQRVS